MIHLLLASEYGSKECKAKSTIVLGARTTGSARKKKNVEKHHDQVCPLLK